jgi:hypothetical protein
LYSGIREIATFCNAGAMGFPLEKYFLHCKKRFAIFPSPAGVTLTKLSLDGNTLIITAQGEFGQ